MVRESKAEDLWQLLELYTHLHEKEVPPDSPKLRETWEAICADPNYHIVVYEEQGRVVSACLCLIVPNLTHSVRPFALVENVVTHRDHRGKGYATACLDYAADLARNNGCYKIMLMTGSKEQSTLDFYRRAGYSSEGKTPFNMLL
ncbi:MAG: GNAT family N-acetyltransferase [Ruminococcus sp.]|nr:GNAT family N-acetyltransferase [Ruminococcus sp.]